MTDRTHPDSGRITTSGDVLTELHDRIAELEQEVAHTDGLLGKANALASIRAHHIAELEAQLSAIGAGGVSGPLVGQSQAMPHWMQYDERTDVLTIHGKRYTAGMFGEDGFLSPPGALLRVEDGPADCVTLTRASLAATAGSEPVALGAWDNLKQMMMWSAFGGVLQLDDALANIDEFAGLHPSPPEGMMGAWMPIETAPKDGAHVLAINAATNPELQHIVYFCAKSQHLLWRTGSDPMAWVAGLTHWMPLPPPPTSSADSRKGE